VRHLVERHVAELARGALEDAVDGRRGHARGLLRLGDLDFLLVEVDLEADVHLPLEAQGRGALGELAQLGDGDRIEEELFAVLDLLVLLLEAAGDLLDAGGSGDHLRALPWRPGAA